MKTVTISADTEAEAIAICHNIHGFMPDAVREVDSGGDETDMRAWKCFESAADAELWDKQQ